MNQVVTTRVPLTLLDAAGHVFHVLGAAPGVNTFDYAPRMVDADGREYGITSGLWADQQIAGVQNPMVLLAPHLQPFFTDHDPPGLAGRTLCQAAQAAFVVWEYETEPLPTSDKIAAVIGPTGREAVVLMGLSVMEASI